MPAPQEAQVANPTNRDGPFATLCAGTAGLMVVAAWVAAVLA